MTSAKACERLAEIDGELIATQEGRQRVQTARDDIKRKLDAIQPRTQDPFEHRQLDSLRTALRQLDGEGIAFGDGMAPELESLAIGVDWRPGQHGFAENIAVPGLEATARRISRLEAERVELRSYLEDWPNGETLRPYRYIGRQYKHSHDGRFVEPGETVLLNESQAKAFADRFKAAEALSEAAGESQQPTRR